jgi:hypothetical protein
MEEKFPIGTKSGTTPLGQTADNNTFTLLETQVPFRSHSHADTIVLTGGVTSDSSNHQHKIPYADSPSSGSDPVDLDNAWEFTAAKGWNGAHAYTGSLIDTDPGSNNTYASLTNPGYMTPDGAHSHGNNFALTGGVTDHPGVAATVVVDNKPSYLALTYMIKAR